MALIIPTVCTTYGDASVTEGGRLRKYVLAQFRADANLEWVRDELKYRDFTAARPRLRARRELWARVENGVGQATVIVIDPQPYDVALREVLRDERIGPPEGFDERFIVDECATALIRDTPIAYLPSELMKAVPWTRFMPIGSLYNFAPDEIRRRIGRGLREAMIFAARAHAMFDLDTVQRHVEATPLIYRSPVVQVTLAELLSTARVFDKENQETVDVLNEAAEEIAKNLAEGILADENVTSQPLVTEIDSRQIDHIQAADIAAGWAREMLELSDIRFLAGRFECVWVNGVRVK